MSPVDLRDGAGKHTDAEEGELPHKPESTPPLSGGRQARGPGPAGGFKGGKFAQRASRSEHASGPQDGTPSNSQGPPAQNTPKPGKGAKAKRRWRPKKGGQGQQEGGAPSSSKPKGRKRPRESM